jgi:hypothetical protein
MEQMLLKLARQLDALDEASLMSLWEKYASAVNKFEPTQRWQEAVLVLSFIQAKRWKNQLFNTHWAVRTRAVRGKDVPAFSPPPFALEPEKPLPRARKRKAVILPFHPENPE